MNLSYHNKLIVIQIVAYFLIYIPRDKTLSYLLHIWKLLLDFYLYYNPINTLILLLQIYFTAFLRPWWWSPEHHVTFHIHGYQICSASTMQWRTHVAICTKRPGCDAWSVSMSAHWIWNNFMAELREKDPWSHHEFRVFCEVDLVTVCHVCHGWSWFSDCRWYHEEGSLGKFVETRIKFLIQPHGCNFERNFYLPESQP